MKKLYIIFVISTMISVPRMLSAGDVETFPYTIRAALDFNYMSYMETGNGGEVMDGDTGWLKGLFLEGRYDSEKIFAGLSFSATGTGSATYVGQYQVSGQYTSNTTSEYILLTEAGMGYKAFTRGAVFVAPYAGLGYRYWVRGENNVSGDYVEFYYWYFFNAGVECSARSADILLSVRTGVYFPWNMEMQTSMNGYYDTGTFKLKSKPGFHMEGTVDYTLHRDSDMAVSFFISPYYQRWNIGKSGIVEMKQHGVPSGDSYYEPDSYTYIMGYRFGVSFYL